MHKSRHQVCREFKEKGGKVAAVLPIHYPRPLLRAFDILPVEVWGPPRVDTTYGGAHLQPYVCAMVHNALSFLKSGGLDETDFILVPHACDSLQGLGSILIDFVKPVQPVLTLYMPRGRRKEDLEFLRDEIKSLYSQLSRLTGKEPDPQELTEAIKVDELADLKLRELYEKRPLISSPEFYRLIRKREYLPAEEFIELAEQFLNKSGTGRKEGVPVIVSGIVPEPMDVLGVIEDAGGWIAWDDFACCGRRLYPPGNSDDPFTRMAERIINGPPDVTRGSSIEERFHHLMNLIEKTGARGVIFYTIKFCEPELFDLPELRNLLKSSGVPSVNVEVDINDPLPHQTITRIEAFLEVLE